MIMISEDFVNEQIVFSVEARNRKIILDFEKSNAKK